MSDFDTIPVLDFALIERGEKDAFLGQLRHALVNVGFLYLINTPISNESFASLVDYAPKLFQIPQQEKDAIAMVNTPHFLGYTRLGTEITKGATDLREQFDFGTPIRIGGSLAIQSFSGSGVILNGQTIMHCQASNQRC